MRVLVEMGWEGEVVLVMKCDLMISRCVRLNAWVDICDALLNGAAVMFLSTFETPGYER